MIIQNYARHATARVITTALLLVIGSVSTLSSEPPEATEQPLLKVLQQRRSILEQLVKVQVDAYRKGQAGFESVVRAREQLLSAGLELASGRDERIKLLEAFVKVTADFENMTATAFRAGKATQGDVLESPALHLNAQARLLRERLKGN